MSKGLNRSLARSASLGARVIKQRIVITDLPLTVVGATLVGFGFAIASSLPQGNILFLGGVANLKFSGPGDANLDDTWGGAFSLGTTGTTSVSLTGDNINLIDETSVTAIANEVTAVHRAITEEADKAFILDNTDGALDVNVSLIIADVFISGTVTLTVDGEVELSYVMLLDD